MARTKSSLVAPAPTCPYRALAQVSTTTRVQSEVSSTTTAETPSGNRPARLTHRPLNAAARGCILGAIDEPRAVLRSHLYLTRPITAVLGASGSEASARSRVRSLCLRGASATHWPMAVLKSRGKPCPVGRRDATGGSRTAAATPEEEGPFSRCRGKNFPTDERCTTWCSKKRYIYSPSHIDRNRGFCCLTGL